MSAPAPRFDPLLGALRPTRPGTEADRPSRRRRSKRPPQVYVLARRSATPVATATAEPVAVRVGEVAVLDELPAEVFSTRQTSRGPRLIQRRGTCLEIDAPPRYRLTLPGEQLAPLRNALHLATLGCEALSTGHACGSIKLSARVVVHVGVEAAPISTTQGLVPRVTLEVFTDGRRRGDPLRFTGSELRALRLCAVACRRHLPR